LKKSEKKSKKVLTRVFVFEILRVTVAIKTNNKQKTL